MYGDKTTCVLNNGGDQFDEELFSNSYQNDQTDGKKNFMKLWLHAKAGKDSTKFTSVIMEACLVRA